MKIILTLFVIAFCACDRPQKFGAGVAPASVSGGLVIADFKIRPEADEHSKLAHYSWRAEVRNDSDVATQIRVIQLEFFDGDGFKVSESGWLGPVAIAAHGVEVISDKSAMKTNEWAAMRTQKVRAK